MPFPRLPALLIALLASASSLSAERTLEPDILVVGGGVGGVSSALAASRNGRSVVLLEETGWLGGQLTSQGVSPPDEHEWIEKAGTQSYLAFRREVRDYYRLGYRLSERGRRTERTLDPGDGWVSKLCHEPRVGVAAIDHLLLPARESGKLQVFTRCRVTGVDATSGTVAEVRASVEAKNGTPGEALRVHPKYVVEATPLGDLLEIAGIPFRVGLESKADTAEIRAYPGPSDPKGTQGFTSCFAVEFREGESHVIPKPALYDHFRRLYSLAGFPFMKTGGTKPPFWAYRRLLSREQFDDPRITHDLALINWGGNDYHEKDLISASPAEREEIIEESRQQSLGFLYWLQTECPRDDGNGKGYPELMLRPDVMGTTHGLSMFPYIRESRRIRAVKTVREQDVTSETNPGARARLQDDTVGIGFYYAIDIHQRVGEPRPLWPKIYGHRTPKPFQIPMGALIPEIGGNVLAGQKNLGVTHITNGCFRLHPTEWNTGEAAGTLAAYCVQTGLKPIDVQRQQDRVREVQKRLVAQGVPIFWYTDLSWDDPGFAGAQLLAVEKGWVADEQRLDFAGKRRLTDDERESLRKLGIDVPTTATREDAARVYEQATTAARGKFSGGDGGL